MIRALPAALFAIPVVALLLGALHEPDALIPTGWAFFPDAPTFASLERAFELVDLDRQLANSALVVVVALPLSVVVASWAGFAMTLLEPRARRWAIGLTLVLLVLPASAVWAPRFVLFSRLGLTDSPVVLMIPALMGTTPFAVLLFHWSFRRIPRDLIDAARLAGLGPWTIWRRVAMPLARPTTAAVAAIVFAIHWGDFVNALLYLYSPDDYTLPLGIRHLAQLPATQEAVVLAGAAFATIPALLAFALVQRRFLDATRAGGWLAR